MAIYHMNVKIGRRVDKQSAFAAACYILRTGDYAAGYDEVLYSASGHMPAFAAADPLRFWDAADDYERDNGRLFRSVEFALPVEADEERRRDLAVMFAHRLTAEEKLPFTLAIHAGKGHNPHCHLLINERSNDGVIRPAELWFRRHNGKEPGRGGAKKPTPWSPSRGCATPARPGLTCVIRHWKMMVTMRASTTVVSKNRASAGHQKYTLDQNSTRC